MTWRKEVKYDVLHVFFGDKWIANVGSCDPRKPTEFQAAHERADAILSLAAPQVIPDGGFTELEGQRCVGIWDAPHGGLRNCPVCNQGEYMVYDFNEVNKLLKCCFCQSRYLSMSLLPKEQPPCTGQHEPGCVYQCPKCS